MKPIPYRTALEPLHVRPKTRLPRNAFIRTDLDSLCRQAGVYVRATVPPRDIVVHVGRKQIRTRRFDLVGVPRSVINLKSREAALRALEALAYSFMDHAARHCVVDRGYFTPS